MPELYAGGDGVSLVAVEFFFHWSFWNRSYVTVLITEDTCYELLTTRFVRDSITAMLNNIC
ncbi:uncharacterized protein METZ01_LOCUS90173 [marine metagenome]|uniref:Uncharacterized protein n=1 Tax=marine metagenome TaxID=408172 RepID=A0A381VAD6_9ZZZZ|tara:strand:+ start:539 stop:721 length:183 start_codon:yes stop_codon:yes gene_type:complete